MPRYCLAAKRRDRSHRFASSLIRKRCIDLPRELVELSSEISTPANMFVVRGLCADFEILFADVDRRH